MTAGLEDLLLVDIGNTRLKWAVASSAPSDAATLSGQALSVCAQPSAQWDTPSALDAMGAAVDSASRAAAGKRYRVLVSCVGPSGWFDRFDAFCGSRGLALHWVRSSAGCGRFVNGYDQPTTLGVDRFCMALAAAHQWAGQPVIVVSAGTATTVDAIDAQGRLLGGYILPGADLMASSLHRNTAQLPLAGPDLREFPTQTGQAIATGIIRAQCGAVMALTESLHRQAGQAPALVLTGGARDWLKAALPPVTECPDLVLQGLQWWARTSHG